MKFKLFKDILTESEGKETFYSQGRFYLLISIIAYYITLGFVTWKALHPTTDIKETTLDTIIEALQWAIALFASYVFGGKVVGTVKTMFGKSPTEATKEENKDTPPVN